MMRAWSDWLVELPLAADLGLRLTFVLALGWGLHAALVRRHPRWRVQLWRGVSVAVLLVVGATFLPRVSIFVQRQVEMAQPDEPQSDSEISTVATSAPQLRGAGVYSDPADIPPSYDWSEPPLESFLASKTEDVIEIEDAPASFFPFNHWSLRWFKWGLAAAWLIGMSLLALRWVSAQWRVRGLIARSTIAPKHSARILRRVADQLDVFGDFDLRVSSEIDVPFVTGLWRPMVILPARMVEPNFARELPAIFAHELSHVKSRDLVWMGVSQWVSIPLWFHPLAWKLTSAHSMACEEVADGIAAQNVGDVARYSGTLARVALEAVSHPPAAAAISMARSSQIMTRLTRLQRGLSLGPITRRWILAATFTGLLAIAPVATLQLAYADDDKKTADNSTDTEATRVLHFPKSFSVGSLSIATSKESEWWDRYFKRFDYRRDWDWRYHGQAKGDVTVPRDAKVRLEILKPGARNTSWIKKLDPDDLYEIFVFPHPARQDRFSFGDAQIRNFSHLTGLRELSIQHVQITGRGLRSLKPLHKLEKLIFASLTSDNNCLKSIGELKSLQVLSIGKADWDDAGLAHLSELNELEEIFLPFSGVPGRGFDAVVKLPKLKYITGAQFFKSVHLAKLRQSTALRALVMQQNVDLTDDSMKYVAQLPQLEYLDLWHTNISDEGVKQLGTLKALKRLNIKVNFQRGGPLITAASADAIAQMDSLEILDAGNVGDVDEFINKISGLKNLKSLSIGGLRDTGLLSDAGAESISKFPHLDRLTVSGTDFSDAATEHLAKLKELKWLFLLSDTITDDGLGNFAALKELRYAHISGSAKRGKLTYSGVTKLNGLTNLTELWYYAKPPAEDEPPLDFSGMPALEKLGMTGFRNQDIAGLKNCRNLKWLQGAQLDNEGFAHLDAFPKMERLYVAGGNFDDDALAHLEGMSRINWLTINGPVSEKALPHLEKLKSLELLRINTTEKFSAASIRRLKNSLPNAMLLTIDHDRAEKKLPKKQHLRHGQDAPPFEVTLFDGEKVSLKDYRGKVLLLYFWSTNCGPCVASVPKLKEAYAELSQYKDFAMIGLSGDDNDPVWKNFVQQKKLTWPQARIGDQSKMALAYGVAGYPRYIVIDRNGKVLTSVSGEVDSALKKALEANDD